MKGLPGLFISVNPDYEISLFLENGLPVPTEDITLSEHRKGTIITYNKLSHLVRDRSITEAAEFGGYVRLGDRNMAVSSMVQDKGRSNFPATGSASPSIPRGPIAIEPEFLSEYNFAPELFIPMQTGTFFDTFFTRNGGIMPGTNTQLGGAEGIGKSSNLIEVCLNLIKYSNGTNTATYISGEMKPINLQGALNEFYPDMQSKLPLFFPRRWSKENRLCDALIAYFEIGWNLIIIDSLKELVSDIAEELNTSNTNAEGWLFDLMEEHNMGRNSRNVYTSFICIQQLIKSGDQAGSRRMRHMMDIVTVLNYDKTNNGAKYMMNTKNRYGSTHVKLYYDFGPNGIEYDDVNYNQMLGLANLMKASKVNSDMEGEDFLTELDEAAMEEMEAA